MAENAQAPAGLQLPRTQKNFILRKGEVISLFDTSKFSNLIGSKVAVPHTLCEWGSIRRADDL